METNEQTISELLRALVRDEVCAELKRLGIGQMTRKQLRLAKGFSATQLARAAQVSDSYVSMLESGRITQPGIRDSGSVLRIAEWLGVSASDYLKAPTNERTNS